MSATNKSTGETVRLALPRCTPKPISVAMCGAENRPPSTKLFARRSNGGGLRCRCLMSRTVEGHLPCRPRRQKWAELEAKDKPLDLLLMKAIFDRYQRDVIPEKAERTPKDNLAELRQLRPFFDEAPIDAKTPVLVAQYRDARSAPVRANREIALHSHVYNLAREWGSPRRRTLAKVCVKTRRRREISTPMTRSGVRYMRRRLMM